MTRQKYTLHIGARKSHLARRQAISVASALQEACVKLRWPEIDVNFHWSESFGDRNLDLDLTKSPSQGLFTADLQDKLESAELDLVVHSWKDLPTETKKDTFIGATLPRQDARDLLLVRKELWSFDGGWRIPQGPTRLRVLSSSPRRAHNLSTLLPKILPRSGQPSLDFVPVRGNIPTRFAKLLSGEYGEALVVAKAAVDRLLSPVTEDDCTHLGEDYLLMQKQLQETLASCWAIALPLSANPTAAAQGALAVECRRKDNVWQYGHSLHSLLEAINCTETFECVSQERATLSAFGGGCHQKIGVSLRPHARGGRVYSLRGLDQAGNKLFGWEYQRKNTLPSQRSWLANGRLAFDEGQIWPSTLSGLRSKNRAKLQRPCDERGKAYTTNEIRELLATRRIFVSRTEALPSEWKMLCSKSLIWAAGLKTWEALAEKDFWVTGCSDALSEMPGLHDLCCMGALNQQPWLRLTHLEALGLEDAPKDKELNFAVPFEMATYKVESDQSIDRSMLGKSHYFWMSGTQFKAAVIDFPEILQAFHACGPGRSFDQIRGILERPEEQLEIFADWQQWRSAVLQSS